MKSLLIAPKFLNFRNQLCPMREESYCFSTNQRRRRMRRKPMGAECDGWDERPVTAAQWLLHLGSKDHYRCALVGGGQRIRT